MTEQPKAKFRAGQVSSAVWENEVVLDGRKVKILKATVEHRYKDKNGQWKSSGSFTRNEIPLAIYCLKKAFDQIIEGQNSGQDSNDTVTEEEV